MTKTEYRAYIASPEWQERRKQFIEAGRQICERCELPRWLAEIAYDQDLHVHHRHYRTVGREEFDDLELVCRRCHEVETFGRSEIKAPKAATCELCDSRHWDYRSPLCGICAWVVDKDKYGNTPGFGFPGYPGYVNDLTGMKPVWKHLCDRITEKNFDPRYGTEAIGYLTAEASKNPPVFEDNDWCFNSDEKG